MVKETSNLFRAGVLSVLIPTYNEKPYLRRCLQRVLNAPLPSGIQKEIIIIDDGSTDGSRQIIQALVDEHPNMVKGVYLDSNQGKGAALSEGIRHATGQYVVFQDADLEYDPDEYRFLMQPILEGAADVVYGSRFLPRNMRRVFNYHHALGNKLLTHFSNATTGLDLTDMETGYKAFRADVLKTIPLRSQRFGVEPEITAKIAKRNCIVYEVPITYRGRSYSEGKKIDWKDGVAAIYTIAKYWLIDDCYEEAYGRRILENLSQARRFNRWMVRSIEPYLGDRILEIGSGIGNISRLLPKRERLTLSDVDEVYLDILGNAFRHTEGVDLVKLDVRDWSDLQAICSREYDTVVCLNVLEHIEDDVRALENMGRALIPGGRLILIVPQYPWLFGSYDQAVGHCRRYTRSQLLKKLEESGFRSIQLKSFNSLAVLGWWLNSRVLKRTSMPKWQLRFYDSLVPVLSLLERILPVGGLSLMCVAENGSKGDS
jgi:glycosyltransferase involved in cell wall biosynthesis